MKIPETQDQEKQKANQARSDKKWNSTMASDARHKLIEELGDDIELIIAVQIEAAAKKAKKKADEEFINTLSALRAKIQFPKSVSEDDKTIMSADRIMAWYLHINFPAYKVKIPKLKRATSKNTAPKATLEQKQQILKMRDEGKTFPEIKEYFKNQNIIIKGQSISMIMKPANAKKVKSDARAGALVASKALTPQERFLKET
jgi:thioesterase domain-containing protein